MAPPLRILYLSAEVAPSPKPAAGDVGGSLCPRHSRALGHDVRVFMPAYRAIEAGYPGVSSMPLQLNVPTGSGLIQAGAFGQAAGHDICCPFYFIAKTTLQSGRYLRLLG